MSGDYDTCQFVCANAQTYDFNRYDYSLHQALELSRVRATVRTWKMKKTVGTDQSCRAA
jgi:hypothetical protein